MGTGGTIASILGAMLLGGMGKGMFQGGDAEDETKKLASDPQILKMKQKNVETPEPLDVQAMMAKHAPGSPMTNDNINRVSASIPKEGPSASPALTNEALMGEMPKAELTGIEQGTGPMKNPTIVPGAMPPMEQVYASPMRGASPIDPNQVQPMNIQSTKQAPGMMEKLIEQIMSGKSKDSLSGVKRSQNKGAL